MEFAASVLWYTAITREGFIHETLKQDYWVPFTLSLTVDANMSSLSLW